MNDELSYAVVTPVRNEADNLERLAQSLREQELRPLTWVIADTGSTDNTRAIAQRLAAANAWITTLSVDGEVSLERGGPIVRGFEAGLGVLECSPDVVVKLDADLSFEADYFSRLLSAFASDQRLGMASGTCYERERDEWRERHVTGTTVWGAARAYRRECLLQVSPLAQRMGWDGVDEFRANARGWRTHVFRDLPFRHHRREGQRDGAARKARFAQGHAAYFLRYRPWYLVLRALWHSRREPAALAMIAGYFAAFVRREPRLEDAAAARYLREQQALRALPQRAAEAVGRRLRSSRSPAGDLSST